MKYRNIMTRKEVDVLDIHAAGMCPKTLGMTLVIYKEEGLP